MTGENESEKMALLNGENDQGVRDRTRQQTREQRENEKPESNKPETKADKIAALKKRQAQLQKQIDDLQAKADTKKRKEETHLKILIGAALLSDIEKTTAGNAEAGAKQKKAIKEVLNRAIQLKKDREFLQSAGWL